MAPRATNPRVSAAATRRSRWKSSALAIAPAAGSASALEARELLGAVVAGLLVAGGEHAEQARPERDRDVDEGPDPLGVDERGARSDRRSASIGSRTDSPVRATWPIMPSPTLKRVRTLSSEKPIAATVRSSAVAGS